MTTKPLLLDLFCGAGGSGMGYHRAGFEVVGVDLHPQKNYPFRFIQADALDYVASEGWRYDAIHASPPCQAHSTITPDKSKHLDLIPATRYWLEASGLPYVIENVGGARKALRNPFMLCGSQFGLKVYRHRLFESNVMIFAPDHEPHRDSVPSAGHGVSEKGFLCVRNGGMGITETQKRYTSLKGFISVAGHFSQVDYARFAMGIAWMNQNELSQAIPPAYTEWIGKQLIQYVAKSSDEAAAQWSLWAGVA